MTTATAAPLASASVPRGGTGRATLPLPNTHACQVPRAITFANARSFVEPTADNKAAFRDILFRLGLPAALDRLLITGHTDSSGSGSLNQALSERRARAVDAVLRATPNEWETISTTEGWGKPELTQMVTELGETDVSPYQGAANLAARLDLYRRYFGRLLGGATVPPIQVTSPALLGCGEDHLLRGSTSSPSRDPSLPAIQGDFRPNRRVEAFFFDTSGTPIACSAYPTWTAACSLTPPGPFTVTIARVDTVPKGGSRDVQITISPPGLPFGSQVTLTLSTTSGTGEAQFTTSTSATTTTRASGLVRVSGITESSAADNIRLSATVTGQPGVAAQEDFTVADAITFFLKFEVWNLTSHAFEPLPAGVSVELMDEDPAFNDSIATRQTDAQGRVFFNLVDFSGSGEPDPDLFFLVHTNGRTHAGHQLPDEWSTNGWLATDGTPGLQENFSGRTIGTSVAPMIFRVGVDVHARFQFLNGRTGAFEQAPIGIPVTLHSGRPKASLRTDDHGDVHAVLFDIDPGDDFYVHVDFEMTDPAINLPRARVAMAQLGWSSLWSDADQKVFSDLDRTSVGTHGAPEPFPITARERNAALYMLKILREWSTFLFHVTGGAWTGVNSLTIKRFSPSGVAFSWPVETLHIPPVDHFDRSTIAHELSHQIMWKEVDFSTIGLIYAASPFGDLFLYHRVNLAENGEQALIEGWAEFVEAIFEGGGTPPYAVATVVDSDRHTFPLGPPPNNRGERVEGAFADGLWAVFQNHVVTPAVAANAHVVESPTGDVTTTTPWLTNVAVRDRFLRMVWNPLKDLRPLSPPTTTAMLGNIKSRNAADWHRLQPELQTFNMAMATPTVTAIAPPGGPPAGGTAVTITGTEFTLGTTTVTIGGAAATNVTVASSTSLTATTPPGALGPANVVVTTPAGASAPLAGGFTYARAPVVSTVTETGQPPSTPARGPTTGGTGLTIIGTDFAASATVHIGGLPGENVAVISPTEITVTTPLRRLPLAPGGVEVLVTNPDGQTGSLNPGFDYFLLPAPRVIFLAPQTGSSAGGDTITITGAGFQAGVGVSFDREPASIDLLNTNDTRITAFTPPLPIPALPGPVDVRVENPDGQADTVPLGFTYT